MKPIKLLCLFAILATFANGCASADVEVQGETQDSDTDCPDGQILCDDVCVDPLTDDLFCGASGDCIGANDGEVCETDYDCVDGICELICDDCKIDETCYAKGEANPANECERCATAISITTWTDNDGVTCDDGLYCTDGDICGSGTCAGTTLDCSDSIACNGTETCNEATDTCDPGTSPCGIDEYCDEITDTCCPAVTTFVYTGSATTWSVPTGVTAISIEVWGSNGVNGTGGGVAGNGARMKGDFVTVPGTTLTIYAGGNPGAQAGGQGSYVDDAGTPLIVAGGGGGGGYGMAGGAAPVTTDGTASPNHAGGAGGTGGDGGAAGTGAWGTGGGGGWLSAGGSGSGSAGGATPCRGSVGTTYAGGAGGGYSGGGGVEMYSGAGTGGGGAGGSYNAGTSQSNTAGANATTGQVVITIL